MEKRIYLFILFITLNINFSKAGHIIGGELTYRCLGNNQYNVTYTFYRDCFGISASDSIMLNVENICGFPFDSVFLVRHPPPATQITHTCPGEVSICDGGTVYGIEKIIYEGIMTLSGQCIWTLSIFTSSRNVPYPFPEPFYITASINNSNGICDTSPVFQNSPDLLPCIGDLNCDDPGIFDAEGDSIVCVRIDPMTSPTTTLTYSVGYSLNNPFTSNPPITFNTSTGEMCFTPQQPEIATIAYTVSTFRNGVPIGQVERDILYTMVPCANNRPQLTGINGTDSFNLSVCAGDLVCFQVYSSDSDSTDVSSISWDSIPYATLTITGSPNQNAYFCWSPSAADIDTIPYCFNITATDTNCHGSRSQTNRYCITVHDTDSFCLYLSAKDNSIDDNNILIYPVPSSGLIHIDFGIDFINSNYLLVVKNILGETVFESVILEKKNTFYVSQLEAGGFYFANVLNKKDGIEYRKKILIVR